MTSPRVQGSKKELPGKAVLVLQVLLIALDYFIMRDPFPWHLSPWSSHFELSTPQTVSLPTMLNTCQRSRPDQADLLCENIHLLLRFLNEVTTAQSRPHGTPQGPSTRWHQESKA